jgi:hypothetical protein
LDLCVIAKAPEPVDARFSSKPRNLALGVLTRTLLNCFSRRYQSDFGSKMGAELTIADELERLGIFEEINSDKAAYFVEPACSQHRFGPFVDSFIERLTRRLQTDFENPPTSERRSACAMDLSKRLPREQANLNGADELLFVGRGDLPRRGWVEMFKHSVQMARTVFCSGCAKALPDVFRTFGQIRQAFQQSTQIEAGADSENGQLIATTQICEDRKRAFAITACCRRFGRIQNIEQMMRNSFPLGSRWLRGSNVKTTK